MRGSSTELTSRKTRVHVWEQWIPQHINQVFAFFSDARNLQEITPKWLHFSILTPGEIAMHKGALIEYRLRLRGIPVRWQSEISVWEPPHRFVDEQRRGPYRFWIHEHNFAPMNGGTMMTDLVRYAVPGGKLIDWLFVRRDVYRIFDFRRSKLLTLFGTPMPTGR